MKRFQDYKKQFKILFLCAILILAPVFAVYGQTVQELREQITAKAEERRAAEERIRQIEAELNVVGVEKSSLQKAKRELDLTIQKLNADINLTQSKIDEMSLRISTLDYTISEKEQKIENAHAAIASDIRKIAEIERYGLTQILFATDKDFTSVWSEIDSMLTVRGRILEQVKELRGIKFALEGDKHETLAVKGELESSRETLADERKLVDIHRNDTNKSLIQKTNDEAEYQKMLKEQQARIAALEKDIRDYESRLQFILDPNALPGPGILSWPLDYIYVTQPFGEKTGPHRVYANGHSGTDFRARTPLPTYAMADGVVGGVGNTDLTCAGASFGQWVFIKYDNGLASTHAHLSLIKVEAGQRVSRGETIGYTGGTGRVTAPHLHISLYVGSAANVETLPSLSCPGRTLTQPIAPTSAYLDPMYYLPPHTQ